MSSNIKRVVVYPELRSRKGIVYTRQHLSRLEKAGLFPRRIVIGVKRVGWLEDEIDAHLDACARRRDSAS